MIDSMSAAWQATGFILVCCMCVIIGVNQYEFVDLEEDEIKDKKCIIYW